MLRTHLAGSLRPEQAEQTVTLTGWVARRRDHGGVIFIDLRDASGVAQVVFRAGDVAEQAHRLRAEYCVRVTGTVEVRPEATRTSRSPPEQSRSTPLNSRFSTKAHRCRSSSTIRLAKKRASSTDTSTCAVRAPGSAIRLRSKVSAAARGVLAHHEFVEVETPTLTRSTPEGARDFLVPSRLQPGSFYALPQSPQLFKQLLMVGGIERYYQIARCYRDEDFRADRQPEFTQLDIEMAFVNQDDIILLAEEILTALWKLVGHEIKTPIDRMTYTEAMRRYGSDKPDLRFDIELVECMDFFKDTTFRVFQAEYVGAVVMPGGASQPRKQLDAWQEWAKQRGGAKGLAYVLVGEDGTLGGPVART